MDWAEGGQDSSSKEAVAGSVSSSSCESRAPPPLPLSSSVTKLSSKISTSPSLTSSTSTSSKTSSSLYCNYKEVAGRLTLGSSPVAVTLVPSSSLPLVKEGGHNSRRDSSPISSLVVVQEDENDKEQKQPTDLSNPNKNRTSHHPHLHKEKEQEVVLSLTTRKNKPIPPPLDLSIGANPNLSLHHHHHHPQPQSTFNPPHHLNHNHHINNQQNNHQYHQQPYLGSPKFTQADKSLPLRKRWHSWSPVPMNGQEEDSMVPLYPDSHNNQHNMPNNKTGLAGVGESVVSSAHSQHTQQQNQNQYHQPYSSPGPGGSNYGGTRNWVLDYPVSSNTNGLRIGLIGNGNNNNNGHSNNNTSNTTTANNNQNHHNHNNNNNNNDNNIGVHIQTPTPFYTPNEPSPKFMNSPVFSYSNPDTSLYQGPFSPQVRASSLYPPPSSPFTNLSLNSPLGPLSATGAPHTPGINSAGGMSNSCFNMIPSTLLSPAPSQASTNSLSYEDLHEKSLSFFTPAWSIFMSGTKVRFVTGMNSMDWYLVDFLAQAQSGDSLGLKGEYAPNGLEVRKFIVTSSAKERIQVTFCPVGDPNHPTIEVNCEPGHPFMVDKKGWCAVKPEIFQEIYGTQCQNLECGDVCLSLNATRSPSQYPPPSQQQQHHHQNAQVFPSTTLGSTIHHHNNNHNGNNNGCPPVSLSSSNNSRLESVDEKIIIPISVVPQTQHMPMPISCPPTIAASRKTFASPISAPASPAKKSKDGNQQSNIPPGETKGRRPMNAFLLFAKDKRPQLIQMYPGKDNRSISVLLGEAWQSLAPTEKEKYASNAKARADEQKKLYPSCWKRRRSQSASQS